MKKRDKSEASALGERLHEQIFDVTEAVLGVLMSEYLAMREVLLRFLTARLGDPAAADDVYQELFVRLRGGALPQDLTNPKGYLFRMAYNLANELSRARRRQEARDIHWTDATTQKVGADTISDTAAADDALASKERLAAVMRALEAARDAARRARLRLRFRSPDQTGRYRRARLRAASAPWRDRDLARSPHRRPRPPLQNAPAHRARSAILRNSG